MQTNNLKYSKYYKYLLGKWSQIVWKVVADRIIVIYWFCLCISFNCFTSSTSSSHALQTNQLFTRYKHRWRLKEKFSTLSIILKMRFFGTKSLKGKKDYCLNKDISVHVSTWEPPSSSVSLTLTRLTFITVPFSDL